VKVEFDRYPPQRFLGELRRFLRENKPPNFSLELKWELVNEQYEEELLQGKSIHQVRNRNCSSDLSFS